MKLYLMILCIISAFCFAETIPDFTVTDLNGTPHHLYDYLDQGMYAVLCFSMPQSG